MKWLWMYYYDDSKRINYFLAVFWETSEYSYHMTFLLDREPLQLYWKLDQMIPSLIYFSWWSSLFGDPNCLVELFFDNYECVIQVNDKGQLRLSRRVLLPNTEPDSPNVKQQPDSSTKDIVASQKAPGKGSAKKVVNVPKDGLAEKNIEQLGDKISTPNSESAPESNPSEDDTQLPQKKFIRRLVSPARDRPDTNKDKSKSSSKAVSSVSSKDENSLVNGEAKIG